MNKLAVRLLLILLALPLHVRADDLGRLFFTPEQRTQLDDEHARNAPADDAGDGSTLVINGIVQKNGGARTVWINGVPQPAGKSNGHDPTSVPVSVPGASQPVRIKVGQKLRLEEPAQAGTSR
jgi:hypothetical protein